MGEASSTPRTSGRLPLLDGLRGLAAIGVLLYHCGVMLGPQRYFAAALLAALALDRALNPAPLPPRSKAPALGAT